MIFSKKTLFSLLLGFDLLVNVLEFAHINFLYITILLSFCMYILLPGFLISLILHIRKLSLWENLLCIVGLSIAFLEFGGLFLNILLPLFGINDPLAFQNLVIGFDIYTFLLFVFAWIRTPHIVVQLQLPRRSNIEKMLYILPVFFPILATLGAIVLNNGGSNILTMILLGAIAFYSLLLVLLRNKISVDLYPYAIFFIGMACLFITSLRSWYISGHDIEFEFYVFQLTNMHHFWNMAFYQDPYNACLSITILPTILTNLLSIQDMYVYKVVFQILFATAPVLVFFIALNYTGPVFAFLSAFLFISFPTFFTDMSMLNRQEIGFIFFGLVVYMMLKVNRTQQLPDKLDTVVSPEISLPIRRILFIIFGFCVVVSHYSTNYVLLGSLTCIYVLARIVSLSFVKKLLASLLQKSHTTQKNTFTNNVFLSLPLVLLLFGMTYFWNNLYTHSSGTHFSSVLAQVVGSIFLHSNNDTRAGDLSYSIFFAPKYNLNQQLHMYVQTMTEASKSNGASSSEFYSQAVTSKYSIYSLPQEQLPPTPLGNWLSSLHIPVSTIQADLKFLCAYLMQGFVFIGLFSIFLLKNKKLFDVQYLLFCFGIIFFLFLITVLPALSLNYGVLRMFQQALFVLSLPIVLGINSILFFVKGQKRITFIAILSILLFLNLSGFVSHLTGEFNPVMYLDNSGLYYDAYYVHKSDVVAVYWLSKNHGNNYVIEGDTSNTSIVLSYGGIFAANQFLPPAIRKDAYVFLPVSVGRVVIGQSVIIFNTPQPFLDDNKNRIYSDGKDNIYK